MCVWELRELPAAYLTILLEASEIMYLPVSHLRPFVYINLKIAGNAKAWQWHTEKVDGVG